MKGRGEGGRSGEAESGECRYKAVFREGPEAPTGEVVVGLFGLAFRFGTPSDHGRPEVPAGRTPHSRPEVPRCPRAHTTRARS
jgi:hypothetical protein